MIPNKIHSNFKKTENENMKYNFHNVRLHKFDQKA